MKILNVKNINPAGPDEILNFCHNTVLNGGGAFFIPMNPIKVIKARKNKDFQHIIDHADWVFPDAWGIKWAASVLYGRKIRVTPGYRLMFSMTRQAAKNKHSVYILGTTVESLEIACRKLKELYPDLQIAGTHHGFYPDSDEKKIFRDIAKAMPHYVFVAMGEYKQEKVIRRLRQTYPDAVFMGVGGSVDLIAGKQPYPPAWIRKNHLEWLYRLFRQPFRAPRFKALPVFVFLVLLEKFKTISSK